MLLSSSAPTRGAQTKTTQTSRRETVLIMKTLVSCLGLPFQTMMKWWVISEWALHFKVVLFYYSEGWERGVGVVIVGFERLCLTQGNPGSNQGKIWRLSIFNPSTSRNPQTISLLRSRHIPWVSRWRPAYYMLHQRKCGPRGYYENAGYLIKIKISFLVKDVKTKRCKDLKS